MKLKPNVDYSFNDEDWDFINFSRAKGGQPRDADSRTLAEHIFRYLDDIRPDALWIENVEEFMSWGPLDANGKPVSKKSGSDYMRWVNEVTAYGYGYDYRILNAADYGAFTSRKRYFAQFNNPEVPTVWPSATHSKNPGKDMFSDLKPWNAVKHCLDFENEGKSIFSRNKDLSEKTLERIYAGLVKYVAGGKEAFNEYLMKYHGKGENVLSMESPSSTLSTKDRLAKVKPIFFVNYHHSSSVNDIADPCPTLTTRDKLGVVTPKYFISKYYSGNPFDKNIGVENPAGSITTRDHHSLITCKPWIMNTNFNNVGSSIDDPAQTITANRKWHYLVNPQWGGNPGDIEKPSFTLIARMDKAPPYLISTEAGYLAIEVLETDSPAMQKIKEFMALYGIIDIKMRMLVVDELLKIQGFPSGYILVGSQADRKKFIGNSVVPHVVKAMCEAMYVELLNRVAA